MVSLFVLLGCNLSYIVDLFAAFHELASASARTLLKLASSVRALLKPYGDTLRKISLAEVVMLSSLMYRLLTPNKTAEVLDNQMVVTGFGWKVLDVLNRWIQHEKSMSSKSVINLPVILYCMTS